MAAPQQSLGPYRIVSKLGAGGMGEVWRATDPRLQRDVAIKVLPPAFASDPMRMARFTREAQVLASLNHPGIASLYGVEQQAGEARVPAPVLVMELVEGSTLAERIAQGAIPLEEALPIATQIAEALEYAHERGVVHRDLKPANIKLTADGRVKILDFGLAKAASMQESSASADAATLSSPATLAGTILGTAAYMAPEQARGQTVDRRADIWAFGVVTYEMLTGRRPFEGATLTDTLAAVVRSEPDLDPLPAAVRGIVARCLQKDLRQRWQAIGDARYALQSPPPAMTSIVPRLAWPWAVAAALALALAAAGGWWFRAQRPAPQPEFEQLTYGQGRLEHALFLPDGHTVMGSERFGGGTTWRPFTTRLDSYGLQPVAASFDRLLAVTSGTAAVLQNWTDLSGAQGFGTLALMPLAGGAPRPRLANIEDATFAPGVSADDAAALLLVRYDPGTRLTTLEFPAGHVLERSNGWFSSPRFSRDGRLIAVLEHPASGDDGGQVLILDRNGHVRLRGPRFNWAQGLAWSPNGREVWYSATPETNQNLYALDLDGRNRVLLRGTGDYFLDDVLPTGEVLLETRGARVSAFAVTPDRGRSQPLNTPPREVTVLDWAISGAVSADGTQMLVGDEHAPPNGATFLVSAAGGPPAQLGPGDALDISTDDQWALSLAYGLPRQLWLSPLGTGTPRPLTRGDDVIWSVGGARFVSGQPRVVAIGNQPGHANRSFLIAFDGTVKPLTPEGVSGDLTTPDGKFLLATGAAGAELFPLDGGAPRPLSVKFGAQGVGTAVRFADDDTLYIGRNLDGIYQVSRLNFSSGATQPLFPLSANRQAGLGVGMLLDISADGKTYLYRQGSSHATLYLVRGLR